MSLFASDAHDYKMNRKGNEITVLSSSCDLPIFPELIHLLPSRVEQVPGSLRLFGSLEAQYFDLLAKLLVLIVEGGHLEVRL